MTETDQRKSFHITADEKLKLDHAKLRESKLYKEQLQYQRERQIRISELRIKQLTREIQHKKDQIAAGKSLEINPNFLDNTKPVCFLESDIEMLQFEIETQEDSIKKMKEEQAKDKEEEGK